ncbi:MAG: hypothetical protein ABII27_08595 [bacterium]
MKKKLLLYILIVLFLLAAAIAIYNYIQFRSHYDLITHTFSVEDKFISHKKFQGCYCENIIYNGWVYYAPFRIWEWGNDYLPLDLERAKSRSLLTRRNIDSGEIQYFDFGSEKTKNSEFVGLAADGRGYVYLVALEQNIVLRIKVDDKCFGDSKIEEFKLDVSSGYSGSLLVYDNYLYITFGSRKEAIRIDTLNFCHAGVEFLNVRKLDADAGGYAGICVDKKGFIWMAPSYNGGYYTGKIVRIDSSNFTLEGTSIIDLAKLNPNARGYHGVCYYDNYVYFVPHVNETGPHSLLAVVDINKPNLEGTRIIDVAKYNDAAKGFINCEVVGKYIWMFPYAYNNSNQNLITVLDTRNNSFFHLDIAKYIPDAQLMFYDGSYDGKYMYLSPHKMLYVDGKEYWDCRALVLDAGSIRKNFKYMKFTEFINR